MSDLHKSTAIEVSERIRSGDLSAEEYLYSILERIKRVEGKIHAFVTVAEENALETAREIDGKVRRGDDLGSLAGVVVAVKDNICTRGIRTTCSSRMLENFVPPYDATVIERLKAADAIIIGKTNMDEFAMGSTTETSYFGATHNPWDLSKVPGGSSGGSAAAVIAEETTVALGSDTGGSIRCPASYCSVIGLKPTYGLVSRYGLIAYANSLEQIGPLTRSVEDCALLLSVISGHDSRDSTSVDLPAKDYLKNLPDDMRGIKIGLPREFFGEGIEDAVKDAVLKAIDKLEDLGASCFEISLPMMKYALAAYYIIAMSEASSNLARYDGLRYGYRDENARGSFDEVFSKNRREGFGAEVRRRIILGTYALSAGYFEQYYIKALKIRTLIRRDFERALKDADVIVGPTMPLLPFNLGERIDDPLKLYMCDILTVPANLTGCPAISIPCGFKNGLPVGMQIIGRPFDEDTILKVAYAFEQSTNYHKLRPPI
ncbi:Asp-tRNA(Asn)/Glu-tRNA(Gln) amidotransferase GatCAB subunit A [Candidatus Bathyarchaeota archaeon]|nr:MAG: Asp-tRNA(Asn)/Glu-tRNA(Gln) amidotransferase GatCAB subunit A [Candidatus Bathyarchaeota archaeon]